MELYRITRFTCFLAVALALSLASSTTLCAQSKATTDSTSKSLNDSLHDYEAEALATKRLAFFVQTGFQSFGLVQPPQGISLPALRLGLDYRPLSTHRYWHAGIEYEKHWQVAFADGRSLGGSISRWGVYSSYTLHFLPFYLQGGMNYMSMNMPQDTVFRKVYPHISAQGWGASYGAGLVLKLFFIGFSRNICFNARMRYDEGKELLPQTFRYTSFMMGMMIPI